MKRWLAHAVFVSMLACSMPAIAQVETVRTAIWRAPTEQQVLGAKFRKQADRAAEAALQHRLPEATALLQPIIEFCDRLQASNRALVSVADAAEYEAYVAAQGRGEPIDWVDMACPGAYKSRAFIDIDNKAFDSALAFLDKAIALAPYWAEPLAERGYLLNQRARSPEALQDYLQALALVGRFQSNAYVNALVLRGLGYTHVELGDLAAAEDAYRKSLDVEPGNALAARELDYIRQQREKRATP